MSLMENTLKRVFADVRSPCRLNCRMMIYWCFLMWIKSIAFPPSLFSGGLQLELLSKGVLFLFSASMTLIRRRWLKFIGKFLFWHQEKRRKTTESVVIVFMCIFLLGDGYCNNEWALQQDWDWELLSSVLKLPSFCKLEEQIKICPRMWWH